MSIQMIGRFSVALSMAALLAGCAAPASPGASSRGGGQCAWSPGSCMYEGQYESGERDYAEQEARRLNQAALAKLLGRW